MEIVFIEFLDDRSVRSTITPHEMCTEKHVDGSKETFEKLMLHNTYCFNINYTVGGYWENKLFNIPSIMLRRCNNYTEKKYNVKCASDEEILRNFPLLYVGFYASCWRICYDGSTYYIKKGEVLY